MKYLVIEKFKGKTSEGIKTFLPGNTFDLREDKASRLLEAGKIESIKPEIDVKKSEASKQPQEPDNRMLFKYRVQRPCSFKGVSYLPGQVINANTEDIEPLLKEKAVYLSCWWSRDDDLQGEYLREQFYSEGISQ